MPVAHPVPAYGLRVRPAAGRSPTPATPAPARPGRLAAGADLFLAEASFVAGKANPPDLHLTGPDCGVAAAAAGSAGW